MNLLESQGYSFLCDYIHLTFLIGVMVSYLYFRKYRVSIGGTLAVGYLAASLYAPLNSLVTVLVSMFAFVLIRFVVLKLFLPRPRQIFAIGLAIGVICGLAWLGLSEFLFYRTKEQYGLALVGVIVPGMITNSLNKQGLKKTLLPMLWMVPLAGAVGWALTYVTVKWLNISISDQLFDASIERLPLVFALSATSVLMALIIQEQTVRTFKLRTGGYVTVGFLWAAAVANTWYLLILGLSVAAVYLIYHAYEARVPLFGKDRFVVLIFTSFAVTITIEYIFSLVEGAKLAGPQNIVLCVLPAIIANDLIQYGFKRTGGAWGFRWSAPAWWPRPSSRSCKGAARQRRPLGGSAL